MLVYHTLDKFRLGSGLVAEANAGRRRSVHERKYVAELEIGQETAAIPCVAQAVALRGRKEIKKQFLRFHPDHVHIEPGQRLMTNSTEHVVVDHEVIDQALEQRVVEDEPGFWQIARSPFDDHGSIEVTEYGQQRVRVAAIAVPDVLQLITHRAQLSRTVGPELAVSLTLIDEAPEERNSLQNWHVAAPHAGQDQLVL